MNHHEIVTLTARLQGLYGDRFPGLTPDMAALWLETLETFPLHTLMSAVQRWAQTSTFRPPGLEDLGQYAIETSDEEDAVRRRLVTSQRPAQPQSTAELLNSAAVKDGSRWARLHVEMFRKGVCAPGRYAEAAALCEQYAEQWPEDMLAWRQEAAWWRGGAVGRPSMIMYERQPGEEG